MKSRLSYILMALGALIAFTPVLGVDYLLDSYIRSEAQVRFQNSVNTITKRNQTSVQNAVSAIKEIVRESPSLCTPTFVANVQKKLLANQQLAQIVVENKDRVQYCDGFGRETNYSILSENLPMIGSSEKISIVRLEQNETPLIKVEFAVDSNRVIAAFVHINANLSGILPKDIISKTNLRVGLTNGEEIITRGKMLINDGDNKLNIVVSSIAQSLPIDTRLIISFASVRAGFADLYAILTIVAALISTGVMLLIIFAIKSSNLPTIDIERALAKGEFLPFYQPVVNLKTGKMIGCEVLVRWVKKDGTILSPAFFIDLAESSGLAVPMTIKLMEQVRKDLNDFSLYNPNLKIGINLFAGHFQNTDIVEDVITIFSGSNILFSQLVFEITERSPLTNQTAVDAVIGGLQTQGCKLAIDDAGTGHSNLAYMQQLNVDIIKIDRVFVNMIGENMPSVPVLDGLISMAFDLGADIIAEGVETEEQAIYLRSHGVVQVQGFLFAPALKKESYIELANAMNGITKQMIKDSLTESSIIKKAA